MSLDPSEKGYKYKKQEILKLVNLTEQQIEIIELYILEEQTGKRHWELDPDDKNIYVEWLNGTNNLRSRVNTLRNMDKRQKAIYNSGLGNINPNDNNPQVVGQQQPVKKQEIVTSSGRTLTPTTAPNLFRQKRHYRRGR